MTIGFAGAIRKEFTFFQEASMLTLPSMTQIIEWFGWGTGVGALAAISAVLTVLVLLAPVVFGMILYLIERMQVEIIGSVNRDFAYFFVNFLTFPGTFIHEMSHLCFGVITGAEIHEICMFEDDHDRLGHVSYRTRGPWFMEAVQHSLPAVAPTVVGFGLGYFLLQLIFSGEYSGLALVPGDFADRSFYHERDRPGALFPGRVDFHCSRVPCVFHLWTFGLMVKGGNQ